MNVSDVAILLDSRADSHVEVFVPLMKLKLGRFLLIIQMTKITNSTSNRTKR